jgi:hypothetical protein
MKMDLSKMRIIVACCILAIGAVGILATANMREKAMAASESVQRPQGSSGIDSPDRRIPENNQRSDGTVPLVTLDELKSKLVHARRRENIVERAQACREIIEEMCKSGFVTEALALISGEPGIVRSAELNAFFVNCNLPVAEAAAILNALPYRNEVLLNVGNLLNGASLERALDFAESPEIRKVLDSTGFSSAKELIGNNLAGYFSQLTQDISLSKEERGKALLTAKEWHSNGLLSNANLGTVLYNDTASSAIEKWQMLVEIKPDSNGAIVGEPVRHKLLENLVVESANEALPMLAKRSDPLSLDDLEYAFGYHATIEPSQARKWYEEQSGLLNQSQLDKLAAGFVQAALRNAEYDSAEAWLSKIGDDQSREELRTRFPTDP